MTLCSNQPSLEYIVKLIHSVKMLKLLNLKNDEMQTVLHLAIVNNLPRLVSFLVSKGKLFLLLFKVKKCVPYHLLHVFLSY